jgi:hypothetical protein
MGILITINQHCCLLSAKPWKHIVVALPTAVPSIRQLTALWVNSAVKEKLYIINVMGGSTQGGLKHNHKSLKA